MLGVAPEKVRMLVLERGRLVRMKASTYPENLCIAHRRGRSAAGEVGPTSARGASSRHHGRDHEMTAALALSQEGEFLALKITGYANVRRDPRRGVAADGHAQCVKNTPSVYRTPPSKVSSKVMFTNSSPVGPTAARAAGGNYYMDAPHR